MKKSWVHKTLKLCILFVWPWILCMLLKTCRTSFWWCFSDYISGQPDSWLAGRGPTSHKVRDITLYYSTILPYTAKQLQTSEWWSLFSFICSCPGESTMRFSTAGSVKSHPWCSCALLSSVARINNIGTWCPFWVNERREREGRRH